MSFLDWKSARATAPSPPTCSSVAPVDSATELHRRPLLEAYRRHRVAEFRPRILTFLAVLIVLGVPMTITRGVMMGGRVPSHQNDGQEHLDVHLVSNILLVVVLAAAFCSIRFTARGEYYCQEIGAVCAANLLLIVNILAEVDYNKQLQIMENIDDKLLGLNNTTTRTDAIVASLCDLKNDSLLEDFVQCANLSAVKGSVFMYFSFWIFLALSYVLIFKPQVRASIFTIVISGIAGIAGGGSFLVRAALPAPTLFIIVFTAPTYLGGTIILCLVARSSAKSHRLLFEKSQRILALLAEKDHEIWKKSHQIQEKERIITREKVEKMEMKHMLIAANALVEQVMSEPMSTGESSSVLKDCELPYSDLTWGEPRVKLGEGSFGTVFKAQYRGCVVAVKTVRVSKVTKEELEKFRAEIITMAPLRHDNLVRLWGGLWNEGPDKLCIVLEFCAGGSLTTLLESDAGTWRGLRHGLALGTGKGLRYLHHELPEPLIHRDIKPANVLVGDGGCAKLADFGESRAFDQKGAKLNSTEYDDAVTMTMVGTRLYCAPEIASGGRYNESADTFSFALVLLCLAIGEIDYVRKVGKLITATSYLLGWRPTIPRKLSQKSPEVADLISDMWCDDFRQRPSMNDVVARLEGCASASLDFDFLEDSIENDAISAPLQNCPEPAEEERVN